MSSLLKNLLIVLGIAIFLFAGYIIFSRGGDDEVVTTNQAATSQAALESQEFLSRLRLLKNIDMDDSIFSDERFRSLFDFREPLPREPVGRDNPFAPVE